MAKTSGSSPTHSKAPARSAARLAAVQALYQMETTGVGVEATIREFEDVRLGREIDGVQMHKADRAFFADLLTGAVEMQRRLDPYLDKQLSTGWSLSRISSTARAILRAGLYELSRRADVPAKAIINEYVELAKSFFDESDVSFINAVLDAAAQDVRNEELNERQTL